MIYQWLGLSRNTLYNLKGGFLLRPAGWVLSLGTLGALLSWIESVDPTVSDWLPGVLFPSREDPQVAQVILSTIASSIMTVVSIVFAILLMTLTLASMQFSPRIIANFVKDHVTQKTLGIFLGTFTYCIAAMPSAHSLPERFMPVLTVFGAMILALCSVGWLLYFIHHISQAISVSHIVDQLASETCEMVERMMPRETPSASTHSSSPLPSLNSGDCRSVSLERSGYIRYLDFTGMIDLAHKHRTRIQMLRRVGEFVPEGVPIASVWMSTTATPEIIREGLIQCIEVGPTRTLQQDIEYGILQIVDIALKAISPAVNDPSTAVTCVDQLSRILVHVLRRQSTPAAFKDDNGEIRVWAQWPDLPRLMDTAFVQIGLYARSDFAVSMRLLKALSDLMHLASEPAHWALLQKHGERVKLGCRGHLAATEWLLIDQRWTQVCANWPALQIRVRRAASKEPSD